VKEVKKETAPSFNGYSGGTTKCDNCQFTDFSQCIPEPKCGDGTIQGTEQCDGSQLGLMTCQKIDSFTGGPLGCYKAGNPFECTWDESKCDAGQGFCGDGIIN